MGIAVGWNKLRAVPANQMGLTLDCRNCAELVPAYRRTHRIFGLESCDRSPFDSVAPMPHDRQEKCRANGRFRNA